jgi:cyanophycin synthetase
MTNTILRQYGVSVPQGIAVSRNALNDAEFLFNSVLRSWLHGVCVKPVSGQYGQHVYIGLRDHRSFQAAFKSVAEHCARVLIEETVSGDVYRVFCVAGRVVAIRLGIPASIEGDGVHNVAELIDLQNAVRRRNPTYRGLLLSLESVELKSLAAQGVRAHSIPDPGERIWLGTASNLHQGAVTVDATEDLDPSYASLVEEAVRRFPGLVVCGVDFAVEQPNAPATSQNCHIIEINSAPGFADFHYPLLGKSRDVAGAIVDYLASASAEDP